MADSLKARIVEDVKDAMRARDRARLGTLRMVTAAIKQQEVDRRAPNLDDASVVAVLEKMLKQRRESVRQFDDAGREDLATAEREEMVVIEHYMPQALDPLEIDAMIETAILDADAATMKDMGRVMGLLKAKMRGRADMGAVSAALKSRLSG